MPKPAGIYVGTCLVNGRVYVGSSYDAPARMRDHRRRLRAGIHSNSYLQNAFDKYGEDAFRWEVVEWCSKSQLVRRETEWIRRYRSDKRRYGYNLVNPVQTGFPNGTMSEFQQACWQVPRIRQKRLKGIKRLHADPKWRDARAESIRDRWQNDLSFRAKMLRVLAKNRLKMIERQNADPEFKARRYRGIKRYQVPWDQWPVKR